MKDVVVGLVLCALLGSSPSWAAGGGGTTSEAPADPDFNAGIQVVKKQA